MARIVTAGVKCGAPRLWDGVRLGPRRTGALRPLVLWQTDGVNSTGVRSADVHTGEAQSVAELGGGTVDVGEAADSSAAHHGVSGVSLELARGTAAPWRVVLGDTHGLGSAGDGGAGGDTFPQGGAAHLLLPALSVGLALVLGGESTAGPVPRVATVSLIADAGALVTAGTTLRVGRAAEQLADWSTAEHSEVVRLTHLVLATLGVCCAGGHGCDLTLVGDGVPDVAWTALAVRLVVLDDALLVVPAAHDPARVDTTLLAADVDAADGPRRTVGLRLASELPATALSRVQRVAGESVLTDAGAVMVVSHTPGVGATLYISTGVHTPVLALHGLADLVVAAVEVGGAAGGLTASPYVISVSLEAGETEALAVVTHSIRAAPLAGAEVRHGRQVRETRVEWVSFVTWLTPTVKAADGVDTDCIIPAKVLTTLVDIKTTDESISIKSRFALADLPAVTFSDALSVGATLAGLDDVNFNGVLGTPVVGVTSEARVTLAGVGEAVSTVTVLPTAGAADSRQDGRHTQEVAVSHESFSAETFVGVGVAGSVQSTGGGVTSLPALAGDTGQRLWAGDGCRAGLRYTAAAREGVTKCSFTAGTGRTLGSDDTLSIDTADHPVTH